MLIRPYRWYGGKLRMAHTIRRLIPEHEEYFEPFMGAATVLLNHPRSKVEVINDLDSDLTCLMGVLADREKGKVLLDRLCQLEYSRECFEIAKQYKKLNYMGLSDIDRGVMVFVLITQSFNATRKSFSSEAYRDTFSYRKDVWFNVSKVYQRLQGVKVKNGDGIDLLSEIAEHFNAFALVDPPYCHELRGKGADKAYACELPQSEQIRLLETLQEAKCKVMLCGYRCTEGVDLYDRYLLPHGWKCHKLTDVPKACQRKDVKDIAEEFIWVNYPLPEVAKFHISMKEYSSLEDEEQGK